MKSGNPPKIATLIEKVGRLSFYLHHEPRRSDQDKKLTRILTLCSGFRRSIPSSEILSRPENQDGHQVLVEAVCLVLKVNAFHAAKHRHCWLPRLW
jgi:hypothetical protein